MEKKIKIGLFGFGCVGQGLYDIFTSTNFNAEIKKICVKNKGKKRTLPSSFFTFEKNDIICDSEINLVVELIDDAAEAYRIVKESLLSGKNVVTANKKMVAEHLEEFVEIQNKYGSTLLYEAAVCGGIPIIRTLAEYYDNELLTSVSGIFNGSTNYILSKVIHENKNYPEALKEAQDLGFAETDPRLDVEGYDPLYKLCIVVAQAYGLFISPKDIFNFGIQNLNDKDIQFAKEKGYKIKLLASSEKLENKKLALSVMPHFIDKNHSLFNVENEYNGVIVEGAFSDQQFLVGKGAGGHPTGSAVLSDISANRYHYKYEYRKVSSSEKLEYTTKAQIEVYIRYQSEEQLNLLQLSEVSEKFRSKEYRYVIGKLSLETLLNRKEVIDREGLFIANVGQSFALQKEETVNELEKELSVF